MRSLSLACLLFATPAFSAFQPIYHAYPICSGESDIDTKHLSRKGESRLQLSPAFLDNMKSCRHADVLPPLDKILEKAGKVNAKGDCEWAESAVSCHWHKGVEFIDSKDAHRPIFGELHCIFPDAHDANSPRVYGGHFVCARPEEEPAHGHHQVGASCGKGLLTALYHELNQSEVRCCDDGTLTAPTEERETAGTLAVRPDFRISTKTMVLDCESLEHMTGHKANAPKFGEPIDSYSLKK